MNDTSGLLTALRAALESSDAMDDRLERAVTAIARGFEASICTLHIAREDSSILRLAAAIGLPPAVWEKTLSIPFGKGMAGICAERREVVSVCNLQSDSSGVVRPGARETNVAGAVVVPILHRGSVVGTLGVGKPTDHVYSAEEIKLLEDCATLLEPLVEGQRRGKL